MEMIADFFFESDEESYQSSSEFSIFEESRDFKHTTIIDFEDTIAGYSDCDFKRHFRLQRTTAQVLIDRYVLSERFNTTIRRGLPKTSAEKEIYIFLWYMANTNTFREISNLFGMSISTAWSVINRVSEWLISIGHEYVSWPNTYEALQNARLMEEKTRIPGILGCIDGSHIKIRAPVADKESYFNRKRYYSISLQGVVDAKKKFINIFCGEPGSLHDGRVLRKSDLFRDAFDDVNSLFPNKMFLLGDSAYPSLEWLVPPFRDNGAMTNVQRRFNDLHSSGRVIVEHAFGLLKTRFRRLLHFTEQRKINIVVNLVVCGCILHNMCTDFNDEIEFEPENVPPAEIEDAVQGRSNRREQILQDLISRNIIH
ncbi:uncharacterized protein LOC129919394 [Episyrphus balteatus]|uniref:uncharacterized protein LOC129919394 n=1 Tax=Episyrphus balteatus TaxID=286459 RepID=UPI002485268C|nr:uncharacterized protein LOC129919394 [Episyrphus balteatus]